MGGRKIVKHSKYYSSVNTFIVFTSLFLAVSILITLPVNAQWRSKTHDKYEAYTVEGSILDIKIDGKFNDWDLGILEGPRAVVGTNGKPFKGVKNVTGQNAPGPEKEFEVWAGGKWNGKKDHETGIIFLWEPDAFYIGLIVTDDEHENKANDGWNGDSTQLAFEMTGKRTADQGKFYLFNWALPHKSVLCGHNGLAKGDDCIMHYQKTPGNDKVDLAIMRNKAKGMTYYEARFSADELGVGVFKAGMKFGASICVNDGDDDTPGQTGWSGWYPHSVVFTKQSEKTGLVVLSEKPYAVGAKGKLATKWAAVRAK
ncbi:TPA: hypothetical protein EYO57_02970 [Candidatus Poribacteria bacterium]|nr:hypothetical protein [Candidatus Poribacteria bacterium]